MGTATIEKVKAETSAVEREAPVIKTPAITWQHEGFCYREAFVRLPEGLTIQDLNDTPTIWRNIQDNGSTIVVLPIGTTEGFKRFPAVIGSDLDVITSSAMDEIVVFSLKG